MATGKGASRWADSEEDAALDAKRRKDKEEKKRLKAERQAHTAAQQQQQQQHETADDVDGDRPVKRRKVTPESGGGGGDAAAAAAAALLRFSGGRFGKCRSVENYDKLNDIEEGSYGWVARARETTTGRVVALKRLKLNPKDRGGLPVTGLREIQILKDCDHRNVVGLHEVVVGEDTSKLEK